MKGFIKTLIPNILYPEIAREYFNKIFFRSKIKELIKYEKNFYKRHAFINKAVSKYQNCKYLEIGVEDNSVFNSIPLKLKDKYGVDPVKGGQYRMTSDEFFKKYENLKFDVIFIDGLHTYKQCQTDCINSMRHLNKNGIIFLHDMLPKSYFEESVPRKQLSWTGDVWKVGVELFNSDDVEFKICNIDYGIGILKLKKNFKYKKIPDLKRMSFNDYLKFYKQFDLIDSEKAIDFISG